MAAGFGRAVDDAPLTNEQHKRHVDMLVVEKSVCTAVYTILNVRSTTLCTSTTGGRGTCGGDSGGPLVVDNKLIGVTSFGHADGFMRVTSYADWIFERL